MKKKLIALGLAIVLLLSLGVGGVFAADQIPSAKAAFVSDDVFTISSGKMGSPWFTVLETQIKTGTPKDLVMDVSAECSLLTSAKLDGDAGSEAAATIEIRVVIDPGTDNQQYASPGGEGGITFTNRVLKVDGDLTHTFITPTLLELENHWIEVYIMTKAAHAFNFCAQDVGSNIHTIRVEAKLSKVDPGSKGEANAYIGNISMVVDEVMLKRVLSE